MSCLIRRSGNSQTMWDIRKRVDERGFSELALLPQGLREKA
jgi:hypothetical protein